jgi:hypothetical protein
MTPTHKTTTERYQISGRFFRSMQARALTLEVNAVRDEVAARTVDNPDQLRRLRWLIQAQRDEASRLRDFLTRASVHETAQARP